MIKKLIMIKKIKESFWVAIYSLSANKMRSILTTLGIIIGVMTVISMITIVNGINVTVTKELSSIGASVFRITKYPIVGPQNDASKRKDITPEQAVRLQKSLTLAEYTVIEAVALMNRIKFKNRKTNQDVQIVGTSENWQFLNNLFIQKGRFFHEMDIRAKRKVCILGLDVVETLFPFDSPIGKQVYVGPDKMEVIGILEEMGSILGTSLDNRVIIPYTSFQRIFGNEYPFQILIAVSNPKLFEACMDEVTGIFRAIRKIPPGKSNDFEIITQDSLLDTWRNMSDVVFVVAIGIAAISLLVGGIGIMNIMLVSVTERTYEIGIRKAVGARQRDILLQFILEAIILAGIGGAIGIVFGIGLGEFMGLVSALPAEIPIYAIVVGFLFSASVGLFFGIYPAAKAAKLDPIEALRFG